MNGCIRTNLEVVPTDSPKSVYRRLRLRARSQDENGLESRRKTVWSQLCVDSHVINSVGWSQIYL